MINENFPFEKMLKGAAGGLVATLPMTVFMQMMWSRLPARELHPLPPRQITRKLLRKTGVRGPVNHAKETALTLMLHFLFGAMAGSLYGMVDDKMPGQDAVKGTLAGMTLWTGSYLGWIPALKILPPATEHPWRMNMLMIVAHFIWGLSLGLFTGTLKSRKQYINI